MKRLTYSTEALNDITKCLRLSAVEFGKLAATRYEVLFEVAGKQISEDPFLLGSVGLDEFHSGARCFHLRFVRKEAAVDGLIVKHPRHLIVYLEGPDSIKVLRVLHERTDPTLHKQPSQSQVSN